MISLAADGDNAPVIFLVTDVEELVIGEAILAAGRDVRLDIVKFAKEARELNVPLVVEIGMAEDQDAMLSCTSVDGM